MKKLFYIVIISAVMFSCNSQKQDDSEKKENEVTAITPDEKDDTPGTDDEKDVTPVILDGKEFTPITLEEFFQKSYEKDILKFDNFERNDKTFENMHDKEKIDTVSYYTFKNSKLIKLKEFISSIEIKDNEVLENCFFSIGMSKDDFKKCIKDFEAQREDTHLRPYVDIFENEISFWSNEDSWKFTFEDDTLAIVVYQIDMP
jgi:hypothetical protein